MAGTEASASGASSTPSGASSAPLMVIDGDATPEEVAAIVAVLSALAGRSATPAPRRRPAWSHPERQVRSLLPHGRGGWRASGLPR